MAGPPALIRIRNLEKGFNGKPVLRGVSLDVFEGETLVIMGGSGDGKSVLLRHMNGLLQADKGEVWVADRMLNDLTEDELFDIRLQFAMVFQLGALFDSLTVAENLSYPLIEHTEMTAEQMRARVTELLAMVGLENTQALYPAELSGGMRKRVALARAIAIKPRAVLYDEPTTGLDPLATQRINELMRDLQRQLGLTSVVITHDLKSAFAVGNRFVLLDHGRIRFTGSADDAHNTDDELMREFMRAAF